MSDKRDGYDSGNSSSVAEGCPYRFVPDQWLKNGLPPNIDPRRFPFVIVCNSCRACETTLQAMKRHLKVCPNKSFRPDLTCGHCRYSTRSWALMCVHLNKAGMHREPPCDPEFAPPEIPLVQISHVLQILLLLHLVLHRLLHPARYFFLLSMPIREFLFWICPTWNRTIRRDKFCSLWTARVLPVPLREIFSE